MLLKRTLVACLMLTAACESNSLVEVDRTLSELVEKAETPTGTLEKTNSKLLVYSIYSTYRVLEAVQRAGSELPGLRQSPTMHKGDASKCRTGEGFANLTVSYDCLGFGAGTLRLKALGTYPNDNGAYELTLTNVTLAGQGQLSAKVRFQVEGLADDDVDDKVLFAIEPDLASAPDYYEITEAPGYLASVEQSGAGPAFGMARIYGESFIFKDVLFQEGHLRYTVRDQKNLWACDSVITSDTVQDSQCKVAEGAGDWAILKF